MIPQPEQFTTVLVGSWNPAIFTPQWIDQQLFDGAGDIAAELGFTPRATVTRFLAHGLVLIPGNSRVAIGVHTETERWPEAKAIGAKILKLLSHTPVTAVGINFGFTVEEATPQLEAALRPADTAALARAGAEVRSVDLGRTLMMHGQVLNLRLKHDVGGSATIHLNYHFDCDSPAQARNWLEQPASATLLEQTQLFLQQSYNLAPIEGRKRFMTEHSTATDATTSGDFRPAACTDLPTISNLVGSATAFSLPHAYRSRTLRVIDKGTFVIIDDVMAETRRMHHYLRNRKSQIAPESSC
ncbi:MAG: hypothetical protein IPJ41_00315 [Phycisphaerales bacterium]|nr:hypothetical protein [Phycisphaerales bacterium]